MKTVIVTGAAGGMGSAVCRRLVREGYRIFALDLQDVSIPGVTAIHCDITDQTSLENARKAFDAFSDRLDCIVHTAGIYDLDSLTEISDDRFRRIFEINLYGVYRINRMFTPCMSKGGRITVITSELAPLNPLPFTGIYAITKSALEKYAYSLRSELALREITVSVIRPGAVKTGLLNVSTTALERFCDRTVYYKPNARRFYHIVSSVESRCIPPEKIAGLVFRSLSDPRPKYVYNINRNILLRILSALPDHCQQWILKLILR